MGEKYLNVEDSAKLYGCKTGGMYKVISKNKNLAVKEMVNKQIDVRVVVVELLRMIVKKREKLQKKVEYLATSEKWLWRQIDG